MQFLEGRLIVSPSDLTGFLECEHLTQQELAAARGEIARPERDDPMLDMLSRRGLEHEGRHLAGFRAKGLKTVEFPYPEGTIANLEKAHAKTVAVMQAGADIIYQGTFFDGRWRCHPDFLIRVERPSKLGDYSYEVADAKLARKAKAAAVLQCCVYSEQLAAIQGVDPEHLTLILGNDTEEELRFKDYGAYYRSVKRLEYLFGVTEMWEKRPQHHAFWAHDTQAEKRGFEQVVDLLIERLDRHPDLHVYHYAAYEPNALKWLASTYATREQEVDRLLRGRVLVDLYRVVRQSVQVGTESYSLKELEALYRGMRTTEIVDAASSIVAYEDWLDSRDQRRLDEILAYNADDCLSTAQLRDWLEARRLQAIARYGDIPRPGPDKAEPSENLRDIDQRTAVVLEKLLASVPDDEAKRSPEQQARYLLGHSLNWHRREAKSEWWEYYRKGTLTDEQLMADPESIGGVEFRAEVRQEKRSNIFRYYFDPTQEYKVAIGDKPHDPRRMEPARTVHDLDGIAGWIELSRSTHSEVPHPTSLIPASPIPTNDQRHALLRLGQHVVDHGFSGAGQLRAVRDLLCLEPPRIEGVIEGAPLVQAGERARDVAVVLAPHLDDTYLAIQGPPGSGKTTIGAEIILEPVKGGNRIGITANSQKVRGHLLDKLMEEAGRRSQSVRAIQKADERDRCASKEVQCTGSASTVEMALNDGDDDIVAGTSWLFAGPTFPAKLDYLVVDEAGQMALANVLAMAGVTRNFIFLGHPNQLIQPIHWN